MSTKSLLAFVVVAALLLAATIYLHRPRQAAGAPDVSPHGGR